MSELVVCRCARHVRREEAACPFCAATLPRGERPSARAGFSRAALYGCAAAVVVTFACQRETKTVTITPEHVAPRSLGAGASCTKDLDCAQGLACCASHLRGRCGGPQPMPGDDYPPCERLTTCEVAPCQPLAMPPYGGAFPSYVLV